MKKSILLLVLAMTLTACGEDTEQAETKEEVVIEEPTKQEEVVEEISEEPEEKIEIEKETKEESATEENSSNIKIESYDLISGGGEKVGKMSVSIAPESEITDDYIKQWFEKVNPFNNSYDILISQESIQGDQAHGVWRMGGGMVFTNVYFEKDENGIYAISNSEESEHFDMGN